MHKELFSEMKRRGVLLTSSTYDILLNGWSKLRNGTEVRILLKDMKELGFKPSKGTISSMSRAFSRPGMTGEARRLLKTLFKV